MKTIFMHESDSDTGWRFFKRAVTVSIILHAVAIAVIAFSTVREKHSISLAPINMIELAEPGQTMTHKPARPTRKVDPPAPPPTPKIEKALPKVAPKPLSPQLPPRIAKKIEETPPVQPAPKVAEKPKPPPQPEMTEAELRERMKKLRDKVGDKMEGLGEKRRTEADVRASIDEMQKRHAAAPQPVEATKPAARAETAGPITIGTGVAKGTIVDMRFTAYRTRLWEHVKARWSLLPSLAGRGLTAVVVANVARNGTVLKAWVETSSGVDAFDQSAVRAVLTSSPLPDIPADIPESAFAEGLGFRFTE